MGIVPPPSDHPAGHVCASCAVRHLQFCRVLDPTRLEQFKRQGATVRIAAGEPLFHQGDPADAVFSVTEGTIRIYRLLPDGRRQVTGFMRPGQFIGLSLDDEHAYSAEAVEPAQLCRFPRQRFETFLDGNPDVECALYRIAAHELSAAQAQMVALGRKTSLERVATFLVALLDQADDDTVHLPMSRTDIADYLGLTKETVSRSFTLLKTTGVVRLLAGDRVRIPDRTRLAALAESAR